MLGVFGATTRGILYEPFTAPYLILLWSVLWALKLHLIERLYLCGSEGEDEACNYEITWLMLVPRSARCLRSICMHVAKKGSPRV